MRSTGCICKTPIRDTNRTRYVLRKYESISDFIYIVLRECSQADVDALCDEFGESRTEGFFLLKRLLGVSWQDLILFSLATWGISIQESRIDKSDPEDLEVEPECKIEFFNGWIREMWGEEGDRLIKEVDGFTESVLFWPGEWDKTNDADKIAQLKNLEARSC